VEPGSSTESKSTDTLVTLSFGYQKDENTPQGTSSTSIINFRSWTNVVDTPRTSTPAPVTPAASSSSNTPPETASVTASIVPQPTRTVVQTQPEPPSKWIDVAIGGLVIMLLAMILKKIG